MEPTTEQPKPDAIDSSRRQQIIRLAKEATKGATMTRRRAKMSIDSALECGRLLLEEKQAIQDRFKRQRGFWTEYFDTHFAKHVAASTARKWMQMANIAIDQKTPTDNVTRIGFLTLGIMPAKVHPSIPGNRPVRRFPSHLSFINRFDVWLRAFVPAHPAATMTEAERQQLKADFRPVLDFAKTFGLIDV
jgi:hypothetical protein